jgi:hypothetical protein
MASLSYPAGPDFEVDQEVGSWFEGYGRFAADLLTQQKSGAQMPKLIAIQAPTRALVATALNVGFSAQAIFSVDNAESRIPTQDLDVLDTGALIQIRFQWQPDERNSAAKTRRVVTGVFKAFSPLKAGNRFPSITLEVVSKLQRISISNNVASVFLMPPEAPLGQEIQTAPSEGINLERWGSFFSQQRPTACTFTFFSEFEKEMGLEISDHFLLDEYLEVPSMSLKNLARLDRLTEDEHAHFVNGYEMLRKFQTMEDEIAHLVEPFDFVILDGNAAIANLVGNSLLRDKAKICILDNGNHERLSDAVASINGEAMHLEKPSELLHLKSIDDNSRLFAEMWF